MQRIFSNIFHFLSRTFFVFRFWALLVNERTATLYQVLTVLLKTKSKNKAHLLTSQLFPIPISNFHYKLINISNFISLRYLSFNSTKLQFHLITSTERFKKQSEQLWGFFSVGSLVKVSYNVTLSSYQTFREVIWRQNTSEECYSKQSYNKQKTWSW